MSMFWKHTPQIVRPRPARRTPVLLCLLTFGLTAGIVYFWGFESWIPENPNPTYTATAYVVEQSAKTPGGQIRVPLAYTDADPERAEDVANALADRYADDRRTDWKRRTEMPFRKAQEATEVARQEQVRCEAQLEQFRRQMNSDVAKPQEAAELQKTPPMIDNPRWGDLDLQLAELGQRRDKLLVDRTPLHPAVLDITSQIDDLKRQMAAIPRQIPEERPSPSEKKAGGEDDKTPELATANDPIAPADREKLNELTATVEKARQAHLKAEAAEKQALKQQQAGPRYSVVYAEALEVPPMQEDGRHQLIWTTLVAGVLMAFGVGSVSTGLHIAPPAASAAQVQADAHAIIVGTIPAENPVPNPPMLSRHRLRSRRMLMAIGLILMAACPAVALWGSL